MSLTGLPKLVEEALNDAAQYDASGAMAERIRDRLPAQKKRARGQPAVNRADLTVTITGDEEGTLALAVAYAKAMHGYEITSGRDDSSGPVMKSVSWRDVISDEQGNPLPFGKALDRLYSAKSEAEGGVLVIKDIYDLPVNLSNATAVEQAKNGAFQMLHDLLTEYAEKDYTPVVVLTGAAEKLHDFFAKNPGVGQYFTSEGIHAAAPPAPPAPAMETAVPMTVRPPLKLQKRPSP